MPSNERSAEFCRGALQVAYDNDLYQTQIKWHRLLAAAEASEAGENITVDCDWCAGSGDGERDSEARQINPCEKCEGRGRHREATQPTAAEVAVKD